MSQQTQVVEQSDVTVVVQRKPACHVVLEVHTSPALVAAARKTAIKKVSKEVSFPGFRKGHAPDELVVKKHPSAVESEWHKAIANAAFGSAQLQARVPVLNSNSPISFDLKNHSLTEGADLTFSFDTEPEVPQVDPKQFHPKLSTHRKVEEKEIDEAIHQMRFFHAIWTPITDRGVQENDYITIDLETLEEPIQKVFDHVRFQVSSERMSEWMRKLAIGAKVGDTLEGMSEPDANASEKEKAEMPPKKIRITIHSIEEATLPSMEEFVQKVGIHDPVHLRHSVRSALEKNIMENEQSVLREQVNDFLINQYAFELPLTLIETETNHRKSQRKENVSSLSEEEKKLLDEKIYNESVHAIRLFYLTRQIVRDAKVAISHDEVQKEAVAAAKSFGQNVNPEHLSKEVFALALSRVILMKAQNYILSQAMPSETEAPQQLEKSEATE